MTSELLVPEPQGAAKPPRLDSTVMKAMTLFEVLAAAETPMAISALSKAMDLQKSNIHRLLNTLGALGYVHQDAETKRYYPSLRMWEIGTTIAKRDVLRVAARPLLMNLHLKTSESVFLSVFNGDHVLYLDAIDAPHSPAHGRLGSSTPAIFPASGKAILAHQTDPAAAIDHIIATVPQAANVDRGALLREFEEIRRLGYATSIGGWRRGMNAVAAPVMRNGVPPTAAVGLGGSAEHVTPAKMVELAGAVQHTAAQMAEIPDTEGRAR